MLELFFTQSEDTKQTHRSMEASKIKLNILVFAIALTLVYLKTVPRSMLFRSQLPLLMLHFNFNGIFSEMGYLPQKFVHLYGFCSIQLTMILLIQIITNNY